MSAQTVQIVVRGWLGPQFAAALAGFAIESIPDGLTRIVGRVPDQAKLFGVLEMLDGLHVEVVSVNPLDEVSPRSGDADRRRRS